jgi:hypothetical protein
MTETEAVAVPFDRTSRFLRAYSAELLFDLT